VAGGTRFSVAFKQASLIGISLSQLIVFRLGAHSPVPLLPQMPTGFSFLLSFDTGGVEGRSAAVTQDCQVICPWRFVGWYRTRVEARSGLLSGRLVFVGMNYPQEKSFGPTKPGIWLRCLSHKLGPAIFISSSLTLTVLSPKKGEYLLQTGVTGQRQRRPSPPDPRL